jgi:nucleotide-binding universal stress UspA family protein
MRIIVCDNLSTSAVRAPEVARLLAERLGDSVHVLEESADAGASRPPASDAGAHATGSLTVAADAVAIANALEHSPDRKDSERPRLTIVPCLDETETHPWSRSCPAEEIALSSPAPTLALRDPAPLMEWMHGRRRLRALCAHDLSRTADDALHLLKQLAGAGDVEIVVVHAHRPLEDGAKLGLNTDRADECGMTVQQILHRELEERVRRILGGLPAEIRLCPSSLDRARAVLEFLERERFDLVVAGTHQRHGVDRLSHPVSLSRALLRSAPGNVLLVPRARAIQPLPGGGISRVLVATDLTWESNQAVSHGYGMLPRGGVLQLLHVVHPRALPNGEFDQSLSRQTHQARHMEVLHESKARLQSLALGENDAPGVTTEFEVVEHTEPAVAIAQAAERFGADVVCMASHRPDSVFGRLFKTRIQAVMAKTDRTLLIVHPSTP